MLAGSLEPAAVEALITHVDQCDSCQNRVADLEAKSELDAELAGLRERAATPTTSLPDWMRDVTPGSSRQNLRHVDLPYDIGPYRLVRQIAAGGMGTVFEAKHRRLGRPFALKILAGDRKLTRRQAERVRREWQAHGSLVHPNIVSATDAGIADGMPYLVTEKINGVDLSRLIKVTGPLAVKEACALIRDAATGLHYAHEQDLVHGDVKPSNLMIDRHGNVKVLDLGTARLRSQRDDSPMLGTLAFMAPEQFDHPPKCDVTSDIYSLGCTLYFLLTARTPFGHLQERSKEQLIRAHRSEFPLPLSDVVGDSIESFHELQPLVDELLAKNPDDRPTSMQAVTEKLEAFAESNDCVRLLESLPTEGDTDVILADPTHGLTSLLDAVETKSTTTNVSRHAKVVLGVLGVILFVLGIVFVFQNRNRSAGPFAMNERGTASPHAREFSWRPSPREGELDGLVLTPARFPGIDEWQLETIAPRGRVRCLDWSRDGQSLLVTSTDGHPRVYRWKEGELLLVSILSSRNDHILSAKWSYDDRSIFAHTQDELLEIDVATTEIRKRIEMDEIDEISVHPKEDLIGVATGKGLRLVRKDSFELLESKINGVIRSFAWAVDGGRVAVSRKNELYVFAYQAGAFAKQPTASAYSPSPIRDIEWTSDGKYVGVARSTKPDLLRATDLRTVFRVAGPPEMESISFRASDNKSAMGYRDTFTWYIDKKLLRREEFDQLWGRAKVAWRPQGDCLAVGQDGLLRILDPDGKTLAQLGGIQAIADAGAGVDGGFQILFRGQRLAAVDGDGGRLRVNPSSQFEPGPWTVRRKTLKKRVTLQTTDQTTGAPNTFWTDNDQITSTAISPSRELVAIVTSEAELKVVKIADGTTVHSTTFPQNRWVYGVDWLNEDSLLLSGVLGNTKHCALQRLGESELLWHFEEPRRQAAASAIHLDDACFLQAGQEFQIRNTETGEIIDSTAVTERYGRRHGMASRRPGDPRFISWGHNASTSDTANGSDALVCWRVTDRSPLWSLVHVGNGNVLTLTPAGEMIETAGEPLAELIWIVRRGDEITLHDHESFLSIAGE